MSEVHVGQFPKGNISRRDFLKLIGTGLGGVTLLALENGCTRLKTPEGNIDFRPLEEGQTVDLVLPNQINTEKVTIQYGKHGDDFTPLQIRQDASNDDTFKSFEDGKARARMMGEVTDRHMYRMVANPNIKDKNNNRVPVHMYPSANSEYGAAGRTELPPNQEYSVLRVITRVSDYLDDHHPNAEKNAHPWGSNPVAQFGDGACIGMLNRVEGKQVFRVMGFVQDLRALVPVPGK